MLLEKLKEGFDFTNHEKVVAQYILENLDKVPGMSTVELAHASFTSKATVVRLSQKLGLKGYREFQLKLVEEINQKNRISQVLANEPINDQSTYSDIQAQSAAFKFATLGVESSAYESINGHYLAARKNKKTVAFLISFTGANRTVIRIARYLREATNNYVVGIVGPYNDAIRKWCHEVVEIPNRDSLLSLDVITSFSAATYVLDIFFAFLLSTRYKEHAESSLEMLLHRDLLLNRMDPDLENEE